MGVLSVLATFFPILIIGILFIVINIKIKSKNADDQKIAMLLAKIIIGLSLLFLAWNITMFCPNTIQGLSFFNKHTVGIIMLVCSTLAATSIVSRSATDPMINTLTLSAGISLILISFATFSGYIIKYFNDKSEKNKAYVATRAIPQKLSSTADEDISQLLQPNENITAAQMALNKKRTDTSPGSWYNPDD